MAKFPGQGSFIVKKRPGYSSIDGAVVDGSKMAGDNGNDTGGGPMNPPALPSMPTFPDFGALTCAQLDAEIRSYKAWLSTPTFSPNDPALVQAYQDAITKASTVYNSKGCQIGSNDGPIKNPPILIVPTSVTDTAAAATSTVPGASAGVPGGAGGGSGSGGGTKAKKSSYTWLWVIGGAVVAYFVFGGKKKGGTAAT